MASMFAVAHCSMHDGGALRRNGIKLARELARMPAFSDILETELHPGNAVQVGAGRTLLPRGQREY